MLKKHEQLRIHELVKKGLSVTDIVERTGKSIGTVYKYRDLKGKLIGGKYEASLMPTELVPFKDFLESKVNSRSIKQTTLYFMLQKEGYQGARRVFDNYYESRKQTLRKGRTIKHLETSRGEQAQVDWGHFGQIVVNGKREKVYLFSYVLSYSRMTYMEFVLRQNQRTLQNCHIHAFDKLGIPKTILYDNMKTVVDRREKQPDGTKKVLYNLMFLEFARYYKFTPVACAPYYPQAKGKVESSIKLARKYFSRSTPSVKETIDELNSRLRLWLDNTANVRLHATTRRKPRELWLEERTHLADPVGIPPFNGSVVQTYHTTENGIFTRKGIIYNLGGAYARMKLDIREVDEHGLPNLEVYRNNSLVKILPVPTKRHSWVSAVDETPQIEIISNKKKPDINTVRSKQKRTRNFDIEVMQREPGYYAAAMGFPIEVPANG